MSGLSTVPSPATSAELPAPGARVHLMGIGGAGMRGLAVLLDEAGYRVSGCDRGGAEGLDELVERSIEVAGGHDPAHVGATDLLVRSSAVPPDHPEVRAAETAGVPVLKRARALGALLNGRPLAGVAGTHGKTTITGMTGSAATAAGLDPAVLVGGRVPVWSGYARPGAGPVIVEADEYDRSFLALDPTLALVSSLEPEHLDTYGDFAAVCEAFAVFAERAAGRDGIVYCRDDPGATSVAGGFEASYGYGFDADAWCRIERTGPAAARLRWPDGSVEVRLGVSGRHNLQNAAAAFVAALRLGADPDRAAEGLASFSGVGRRLEVLGGWEGVTIVDDYAHHPTEVAASLSALRDAHPGSRLRVVFQPHLFTRTRDFAEDFAAALSAADEAWVLPIYPAREAPIEGVTAALITDASPPHVRPASRDEALRLADGGGGVLVFMGAGDVTELARRAAERAARAAER